ncbi:MAG: Shedu anti-phage system protein SduA domain-containing protein [Bacteroidia bacterium]
MNKQNLLPRLASLSRDAFEDFIFRLWSVDNVHIETSYVHTNRLDGIDKKVYEQHSITWEDPKDSKSYQSFNLIVPFFKPLDLLLTSKSIHSDFKEERKILYSYKRILDKRMQEWFLPQDGEFCLPNIYFVSNISGIRKEEYFDNILPRLSPLVKGITISQFGIGTYDSFIDQVPEKTEVVLNSLLQQHFNQISVKVEDGHYRFEIYLPESYLTSGVLHKSQNPVESIITDRSKSNDNYEVLNEFADLINRKAKEDILEKFIKKHYQLIFGNHYDRIETQVWLKFPDLDISGKNRRLDIFLRNAVEGDWELFELKRPTKLVRSYRSIPSLTAEFTNALSQLKNYKRILLQDNVRRRFEKEGIDYYEPELRLVIGRKPNIPQGQWRRLKTENQDNLKLLTFDDLLEEMKFRLDSFSNSIT